MVGVVLVHRQRTRQRPLHRGLALPQDITVEYNFTISLGVLNIVTWHIHNFTALLENT